MKLMSHPSCTQSCLGFNQTKAENVTFLEAVHATIMFAQALNEVKSNNLVNLTMTEREWFVAACNHPENMFP